MNKLRSSTHVLALILAFLVSFGAAPVTLQAAWLYWDTNNTAAGLGTTAGTWATGSTTTMHTLAAGEGRGILDGILATTAATTTTTSDTLSFGTLNLALSGAATTVTVSGTQNIGNITFGLAQTNAMTLTGGTINFAAAGTIYALAPNTTQTIASDISGAGTSLTKGGQGTLLLTGTNTYIGTTIITSGGMLQLGNGGAAGTLNGATGTALTFNSGGGIFNLAKADTGSQNMQALTFTAGDGTVRSTAASGAATQTLTFASLAARAAGATGNFELATNTTAADNKIVLTGAVTGFLDKGLFFGGSSYAAYDAGGYVRGLIYGTDANTAATDTITASNHVQLTSSPAARTGDTLLSLNLSGGGVNYTMNAGSLTVPAILKSGGGAVSTISGGTSVTTAANAELVIRTDTSSDLLTISSAVTGFSGGLTKTGAGTVTLSGGNGYTGTTTINAGTLAVSGGSAIADAGSVVLADAAGATFKLSNNNETIANLSGGGFSGGNVDVQGNTLTINMTGNQTFGGTFTGTSGGAVTKTGSNTLTLNNANSFAGTFNLDAGSLTFALGNSGTTLLQTISSGGAINMEGGTTLNVFPANQVALGQQTSNGVSQLTVAGAGYVISNNISVTSGTGTLVLSGNQARLIYSGEISGGASGNQILKANSGISGNGGGQQYLFSGVVKDGTGGSTLGVTIDAAGTGAAANPHLFSFTGQNTFTGPIVAQNTITSTGGVYFVIGGERINNTTGITIGNGYLGGGNYSNTISLATGTILDYASTANQSFGGIISGNGSFVKEVGTGNVTFTANNNYTGATTLNTGTVDLGGGTANGALGSAILNLGGVTLNYTRTGSTTQALTTTNLTAGANTITAVAGNTLTLGALGRSGSGTVNFGTTGTITTSTTNDATGIIGGWATIGGTAWAVANGPASAITPFAGPYTLTSVALNVAASYASNNISVDSNQSPAAVITPNTLLFNTAGAFTLTLTGTTNTINSSGIMVNSTVGNNASTITGGTIRGNSGGSLNIIQNNTNALGTLTIGSIIANNTTATGLNKSGAGTLILTANASYTGTTFIQAGTLQLGSGGATGTLAATSPIVNNGSLLVNHTSAQTLAAISGTGSVTFNGSATPNVLTLNNTSANNFSGGFTLNSGQVGSIQNATYFGFGTGLLTINGGSLRGINTTAATIIPNDIAWNATFGIGRSGGGNPVFTFNGAITLNGSVGTTALGLAEPYSMTFNGNIGEATAGSSLTFGTNSSGHVFTFNGQNTFTGGINTSSKALVIGGSGYLGGGNYAGAISSSSLTYSSSSNQILGGNISGTTLTKDTSSFSTLTLSGTNSFSGTTTVSAGTLKFAKTVSLYGGATGSWTAANINVKNGATLALNVDSAGTNGFTFGNLNTLLGNISVANTAVQGLQAGANLGFDTSTATGGTFTQGNAIANSTGANGGAIGLTKLGTGTLVLDKTNTYTGATTVNAGTLQIASTGSTHASSSVSVNNTASLVVNGTLGGDLTTASGTFLSGTGSITGDANIQGTHNPGNSPGIQSFGNLSYTGGSSVVNWELRANTDTNAPNPSAFFDQIIVSGDLDFAGATALNLSFNPSSGSIVDWTNSFWSTSKSWLLYDVAGSTTNPDQLGLVTTNWQDSTLAYFDTVRPSGSFYLSQSGQDIILNYSVGAVPEPSRAILMLFGAAGLLLRRRCRKAD